MNAESFSDTHLAVSASGGDGPSLGVLFERYRPALHAHALRLLGYNEQAEDAVQDAFLIALTRIGGIRNPAAVKQWLYQVVTNVCFMHRRRSRREVVLPDLPEDEERAMNRAPLRPEEYVERLAMKDLVWRAVGELSDPLASTLMLRYFSEFRTYNEIAVILGLPVGTVRSRLAEARRKMLAGLREEAPVDAGTGSASIALSPGNLRELWRRLWEEATTLLPEFFDEHLELVFVHPHEEIARLGRTYLEQEIRDDLVAGTAFRPHNTIGTNTLAVIEGALESPPENRSRCPPRAAIVLRHDGAMVRRMRVYLAPKSL